MVILFKRYYNLPSTLGGKTLQHSQNKTGTVKSVKAMFYNLYTSPTELYVVTRETYNGK